MARRTQLVNPQQIISILFMTALLLMVITMRTRCAQGTASLFDAVSVAADGGPAGASRDGGGRAASPAESPAPH